MAHISTAGACADTVDDLHSPVNPEPPMMTYAEYMASRPPRASRKKSPPKRSPQDAQGPTPMRPAVANSWEGLQRALGTERAACKGDARYVQDKLTPAEASALENICSGCPVYFQCASYAATAKPAGGFWPTLGKRQVPTATAVA